MTTSRKFATSPDVLVAKGKIKSQMRLYWSQFRGLPGADSKLFSLSLLVELCCY